VYLPKKLKKKGKRASESAVELRAKSVNISSKRRKSKK